MNNIVLAATTLGLLLVSCGVDHSKNPQPDTEKPTVDLSVTPDSVKAAGYIRLEATAKDNIGVTKVEFYKGKSKLGEDTEAPYQMTMPVTSAQNGKLSFTAKAYDKADNTGESAAQSVTINIPTKDTVAPTIVSITPSKAAKGVYKDANIVVTFSEPMNKASTQMAFQSTNIGPVTFSWDATGKKMTINPNNDFQYTPNGQTYTYKITTTATDLAGNAIASDQSFKFKTMRELNKILYAEDDWNGYVTGAGKHTNGLNLYVGDTENNISIRSMMTFKTSDLPSVLKYTDIISAKLKINVSEIIGDPLRNLRTDKSQRSFFLEPITYTKPIGIGAYNATVDDEIGFFHPKGNPNKELAVGINESDITKVFRNDWKKRVKNGSKAQYRLAFPKAQDNNNNKDIVYVSSSKSNYYTIEIELDYLVP